MKSHRLLFAPIVVLIFFFLLGSSKGDKNPGPVKSVQPHVEPMTNLDYGTAQNILDSLIVSKINTAFQINRTLSLQNSSLERINQIIENREKDK